MERDVIISKGGVDYGAGLTLATGGYWTSDTLTEGGIAMFNKDQSVIDGTATVLAADLTGKSVTIGMMGVDGFKVTTELDRAGFKYFKKAYAAPVKAVKCLGSNIAASASGENGNLNLPSSISAGDIVGVSVKTRAAGHEEYLEIDNYSFVAVTGDILTGTGASNIITKLAALINADADRKAVAVVHTDGTNNDGIKFTAVTAGVDFDVIRFDGLLKDANVVEYKSVDRTYTSGATTNVVENVTGQGTPAQATFAEFESQTRDGNTHTQVLGDKLWKASTNVVSSATYTTYQIYATKASSSPLNREVNYEQMIEIFVPSGETGAGESITVLDEILALVNP